MNIKQLMRNTIKNYFENKYKNIKNPLIFMINVYIEIISNDYNDDVIWSDIEPYNQEVEICIDEIKENKYDGIIIPEVYEELIDWINKGDVTIDFVIKNDRKVIKDGSGNLEKLLDYCGIKYRKNVDYEKEAKKIQDIAMNAWREGKDEQDTQDSLRWR
jgi:hypothetical protein